MSSARTEHSSLEARIERLEHHALWWRRSAGTLGVMMIAAIGFGAIGDGTDDAASRRPPDLVVRSLKLKDVTNTTRIELDGERGWISCFDEKGQKRLFVAAHEQMTTIELLDDAGKNRATLAVRGDSNLLALTDSDDMVRFAAVLNDAGEMALFLNDGEGRPVITTHVTADGQGQTQYMKANGEQLVEARRLP